MTLVVVSASARADEPVLHEYVPDIRSAAAGTAPGDPAALAGAIVYDGEVIAPPPDDRPTADEHPMRAAASDSRELDEPGHRSLTFRPDRVTALHETATYDEVFTPSVAPYKRMTALDTVSVASDGRTPVLGIGSPELRRVPISESSAPPSDARARDSFWGSVALDVASGRVLPLPSVSPESEIRAARTTPGVPFHLANDGADNFYVVIAPNAPRQLVRLTFLTDAPQDYFNAAIPDVRADSLASEVPPLADSVRSRALVFARELGLTRDASLREALDTLTVHFRSFVESEQPPDDTGDIYLDLARGKRGVCRHRAYAFVITTQALGIPARFVQNEGHAWSEVKIPSVGWMRVELGGAAQRLVSRGVEERPRYRPRKPDPFPRPEQFVSTPELGSSNTGRRLSQPVDQRTPEASAGDASSRRVAVRLLLDSRNFEVLRGQSLLVSGRAISSEGLPVAGVRVEIVARADRDVLLGVAVTDADGGFAGSFGVPAEFAPGDYALVVRAVPDARFSGAIAD